MGANRVAGILFILALSPAWSQDFPPQPNPAAKVCVAAVSNMSPRPAILGRMTERLSKGLKDSKIRTFTLASRTTTDHKLHLTRQNREEAKRNECDYVLLTQIADPRAHPYEPQMAQISIGGRAAPSLDASDSGATGLPRRASLRISFALFRMDRFQPVLDDWIMDQPSGHASDNLLEAMDRESRRVAYELKRK